MNTNNAYIFSWDCHGIESIIPIGQYERWDQQNLLNILADRPAQRNPLNSIVQMLLLRAQFNPQRHYEIYAVDCAFDIDENEWHRIWTENPQGTADLIRERGHKLYSNRADYSQVKIK